MDDVDVSALHRSIRCGGKRPRASPTRPMFPEGTYNTPCPPAIYVLSFLRFSSHLDLDPFRAEALDELGEDPRVGLNRRP